MWNLPPTSRSFPGWLLALALFATWPPCAAQQAASTETPRKLETFLLLPEPRVMRSPRSLVPTGANQTVLSPAREVAESPFIETYDATSFASIGISVETFSTRAQATADRLLRGLQPDWVRDENGQVLYAVFRGERPIYASLLVAPSLPLLFEAAFGPEIWVAAPNRQALYVFPAKTAILSEFSADLKGRYESDAYAASCEIFSWKKGQLSPVAIASFGD